MIKLPRWTAAALFGVTLAAGLSTQASALIIDLAPPDPLFGPSYSQNGYTFTNSIVAGGSYANWVPLGVPQFNASNANGDVVQNTPGSDNTLTNDLNQAFSFTTIGLADVMNRPLGGDVVFTFNHAGGGQDSITISLADISGLQTFTFNETNLTSVVFTPTTTTGRFIQFDDVGVAAVPEPSAWAMMILGFAGIGAMTYRRRKQGAALYVA
jgi:hypothetical protein